MLVWFRGFIVFVGYTIYSQFECMNVRWLMSRRGQKLVSNSSFALQVDNSLVHSFHLASQKAWVRSRSSCPQKDLLSNKLAFDFCSCPVLFSTVPHSSPLGKNTVHIFVSSLAPQRGHRLRCQVVELSLNLTLISLFALHSFCTGNILCEIIFLLLWVHPLYLIEGWWQYILLSFG